MRTISQSHVKMNKHWPCVFSSHSSGERWNTSTHCEDLDLNWFYSMWFSYFFFHFLFWLDTNCYHRWKCFVCLWSNNMSLINRIWMDRWKSKFKKKHIRLWFSNGSRFNDETFWVFFNDKLTIQSKSMGRNIIGAYTMNRTMSNG